MGLMGWDCLRGSRPDNTSSITYMLECDFEVVQTMPVVVAGRERLSEQAQKNQCRRNCIETKQAEEASRARSVPISCL